MIFVAPVVRAAAEPCGGWAVRTSHVMRRSNMRGVHMTTMCRAAAGSFFFFLSHVSGLMLGSLRKYNITS